MKLKINIAVLIFKHLKKWNKNPEKIINYFKIIIDKHDNEINI